MGFHKWFYKTAVKTRIWLVDSRHYHGQIETLWHLPDYSEKECGEPFPRIGVEAVVQPHDIFGSDAFPCGSEGRSEFLHADRPLPGTANLQIS